MTEAAVTREDISAARRRIATDVRRTPLMRLPRILKSLGSFSVTLLGSGTGAP